MNGYKRLLQAWQAFLETNKPFFEELNRNFQDEKALAAIRTTHFNFTKPDSTVMKVEGADLVEAFKQGWTMLVDSYFNVGTEFLDSSLELLNIRQGANPTATLTALDALNQRLLRERKLYTEDWGLLKAASLGNEKDPVQDKLSALGARIHQNRLDQVEREIGNLRQSVKRFSTQLKRKGISETEYRGMLGQLFFGGQSGKKRTAGYREQIAGYQTDEIRTLVQVIRGTTAVGEFNEGLNDLAAACDFNIFRALEGWLGIVGANGARLSEEDHQRVSGTVKTG